MIGCFVMEVFIEKDCCKPQEKRGIFAIWKNLSGNHTSEIARRSIESHTPPSRTQRANDDAKQKARKAAHGDSSMNDATINAFRQIHEAMQTETTDWQWIGPYMSQRMFGITESRAKAYAERHGGKAEKMS